MADVDVKPMTRSENDKYRCIVAGLISRAPGQRSASSNVMVKLARIMNHDSHE
jgi:hypothetical protein